MPKTDCVLASEAPRETTMNNPLMAMPYRYEVKQLKGPLRLDYPTPCDDQRIRLAEDEVIDTNRKNDRIFNEMWRGEVDEKRMGVRLARIRLEVKEEVRVERKLNIQVRREALRHLLEEESNKMQVELNEIGLSFNRQIFC